MKSLSNHPVQFALLQYLTTENIQRGSLKDHELSSVEIIIARTHINANSGNIRKGNNITSSLLKQPHRCTPENTFGSH